MSAGSTPRLAAPAWGLLMFAQGAVASGSLALIDATPATDKLALGASAWQTPRSPDVAATRALLTPAFDWYSHTGWFVSTENGLGRNLSNDPDTQAGFRLWPQWGRAPEDARPGLPALGPRWQAQVFANRQLAGVLMLQSAVSWGGGRDRNGLQTEWGALSGVPTPNGLLGVGASATWANGAFRRDLNGQPTKGWSDVSWTLSLDQRLSERWHVDGQWLHTRLLGPSAGWTRSALLSFWRDW